MWSYDRHELQELELSEKLDLPSCYTDPGSVDAWRHRRMLSSLTSLATYELTSTWLTVGDGRYGSDASFLDSLGLDVTATSISAHTLEVARDRGLIRKFSAQNAECFSLQDSSVDFVLCKEAYHHFPRPAIGFYEMLRVARKGIVLIEPAEQAARILDRLKVAFKRALRRSNAYDQFEPAGNFIYRLSIREISKMLTALNLRCVAWKGFNDFWYSPFAQARSASFSLGWIATRFGIAIQNLFCKLRLLNYGLTTVVCFKDSPDAELRRRLKRNGFRFIDLPVNPYLDRSD